MSAMKKENIELGEITHPNFIKSIGEISKMKLPAKAAYWLGRSLSNLNSKLEEYNKTRQASLKKYAKLTEAGELLIGDKGEVTFIDSENQKKFIEEIEGLHKEQVEIIKINFEALGDNIEIEPSTMVALENYFFSPSEENKGL